MLWFQTANACGTVSGIDDASEVKHTAGISPLTHFNVVEVMEVYTQCHLR